MASIGGTEIDLLPTEAMRTEAERYRAWRREGRQGGTDVAATRASQILSGDELSPDTVITMAAWFARHEVDKAGEGFSPGEDGYPSPGRVAWAAWGGDPGKSWADARAARIKAARGDRAGLGQMGRPYPNEHAARLLDPARFEQFRRDADAGGGGIDFIYGIRGSDPVRLQAIRFAAARYTAAEARKWLANHDHKPILFEEATGRMATEQAGKMDARQLNRDPLRRVASFEYEAAVRASGDRGQETESRALAFSFSSEAPVARWFGDEVLSHDAAAVGLTRLNDGAPLLWNHNPDQVLGVVERGWIDDKRRGAAVVRFSRSPFAEEKLAEIRDGILRNVSVGYSIAEYEPRSDGTVVATSWQPLELSIVSVPADQSIGVGRSLQPADPAAPAATTTTPKPSMETIDLTQERAAAAADAVTAERSRIAAITSLTREHGADDLAGDLIASGASEADAMRQVLGAIAAKRAKQPVQKASAAAGAPAAQPIGGGADIGLTEKEARSYSFVRAIRAQAFPNDRAMWDAASFEREVSEATAQRLGVDRDGFHVPHDVLRRDLTAGTASAGGDLVFTDARPGSFIELLRNRLALTTLGAQMITGLNGPVAIPKQLSGATAYWLAEKGEPTESSPTVGQVNLTPKTLGAFTEYSRRLLLQSSMDVETMVRNELVTVMALEIDRAALYGTGSTSQPQGLKFLTGLNTVDFAANAPTYAELVDMESAITADNADIGAIAYLTTTTRYGGFKTTEKASSTAQFVLEPGGTVNGYPVVRSNQVESNDVWLGVWNQMLMGMWGAITIQVNPYALDKSGGVRVTAFQDVDVAVRYPECFCRGNNNL